VLYLDFTGHTVANTAWNTEYHSAAFDAPAYDVDGDPGSFSAAEQDTIQAVWAAVAEDYAPFDLDVTTEEPGQAKITRTGLGDAEFGTRVVITPSDQWLDCECGGVAYLGVVDEHEASPGHDYYQPAFAFAEAAGGTAKGIAEVVAHEAGHNVGLSHDGVGEYAYYYGQGAWAPIMGAGYRRPITQWSRGDYSGATNTEDDFAVVASHGVPLRADDHGNARDTSTAVPVLARPGAGSVAGVIGTAADVDYFTFTTTATSLATVAVRPPGTSPNLDAAVTLYDAAGRSLAVADPPSGATSAATATGLSAAVSVARLPAGTYHAKVSGVGSGDPATTGYSDYGSVGRYTVTFTVAPVPSVRTTALSTARRGRSFQQRLSADGGTAPYRWSISSGRLPAGLRLSASGVVSGTPTARGTVTVTVAVTDAWGARGTRTLRMTVR
jgi:hypothetical protein